MLKLTMMKTMLNDAVVAWPETKDFLKKNFNNLLSIYKLIIKRKRKDFDRIWVDTARIYNESLFFYFAISIRNWIRLDPEGNDVAVNVLEEYLNKD